MRDIKFRALGKDGKWVYYGTAITGTVDYLQLRKETESQFTGLLDRQGVDIYEGDIITVRHKKGEYLIKEKPTTLYFSDGAFQFELLSERREMFLFEVCNSSESIAISHTCEVIGNIYDNPELLS